jgi:hypothetical protein
MEKHPYTTTGMLMRLRDIHGVMSRWLADPRQPNDGRLAIALMAASHDDRMYAVLPAIIDAIPRRGLVMESAGDPGCDWDIIASPHLVSTWSMERPDIAIAALTMIRHRSHVRMPFYALPWGTWEPSDRERVAAAMRQVVTDHPSMASGWMDRCWGTAWMRQDEQRLGVWPLFSNPDVASRAIAAGVDRHMITTLAIMHPHSGMATLERMGTIPESWS